MQRELVERARSGDREAFSVLAGASISRLYAATQEHFPLPEEVAR